MQNFIFGLLQEGERERVREEISRRKEEAKLLSKYTHTPERAYIFICLYGCNRRLTKS